MKQEPQDPGAGESQEDHRRAGRTRENAPPIDFAGSFDSLDIMERVMRHFYLRALIEERIGSQTDWNAVDSLMLKALGAAEKVARYRHAQLSAVKIAGELKSGPADGATLDELLERIKHQLTKLGPILELEVAREPDGFLSCCMVPMPSLPPPPLVAPMAWIGTLTEISPAFANVRVRGKL